VTERAAPFHCPYCGDEDLRPSEQGHGAWECRACNRAFQLKFLGLLAEGFAPRQPPASRTPHVPPPGGAT
jgi:transposase-like protein